MSKLRLLIVGLCGVLFSGCGFFDIFSSEIKYKKTSIALDCVPSDLMKRLADKRYYYGLQSYRTPEEQFLYYTNTHFIKIFNDNRYDDTGITKCYDLVIESYNEAVKNAKTLPTTIKEELEFEREWLVCDKMPLWLENKLDEYIEQNKNDDIAYINASKFKGAWNSKLSNTYKYVAKGTTINGNSVMLNCVATKAAIKAIENDLIDLGNGKKAKCADLSYDDAPKCLDYFISVYDKAYKVKKSELDAEQKEIDIKKERKRYEERNKR